VNRHRALIAFAISLAMVIVMVTLFPRVYLVNDDVGFTEYLRKNTFTPWISPPLVRVLAFAYEHVPGMPWYGLYQYALIVVIGAVIIHTVTELIDQRPGVSRSITLFGAVVLGASHAIVIRGITWTAVSISALGTGLGAFIAHALTCHVAGKPMSWSRALLYGLLFTNGYMLRYQGLGGVVIAMAPLGAWATWRFWRSRHLPRIAALVAFAAPFFLVLATQHRVPVADQSAYWDEFNEQRGRIHGHLAYNYLDKLAPEMLERAGWTLESYHDFIAWRFIDEDEFPLEKVQRLVDTGGVPQAPEPTWIYNQLREIVHDSSVSVFLFLLAVAAGIGLAWLGMVDRNAALFSIGYLVFVTMAALWTGMHFRFPQRVSVVYYAVSAFGLYIYLARVLADRAGPATPAPDGPRARAVAAVIGVLALGWAHGLLAWIDRPPWRYEAQLQAFEDRVAGRNAFVFVHVQAGQSHHDPLRVVQRSYDGLAGGWGVFSPAWYRNIARLGVRRGADVFGAMIDNRNAYFVAAVGSRGILEDWIRRKTKNPLLRLAMVDAADVPDGSRPELYRLVTTPMVRGDEEWRAHERLEDMLNNALPGPPSVAGRSFRSIAFAAPYEQYAAQLRSQRSQAGAGSRVAPIDGGLRVEGIGDHDDSCAMPSSGTDHIGIRVPVSGLGAARFEVKLIDPENVLGFHVYAQTRTSRSIHWRWDRDPEVQSFSAAGTFTLVPGYPAHQLAFVFSTARPSDVTDLYFFVTVKPETRAGFELRHLEVASP
jgi:hypothetical protein